MITACTTTNLTQTCFYHSVALYLRRSACKQNLVMSVHSVVVVIGINGWNKQLPPPPPPTPLRPPLITLRKAYYQNSTYLEYCVPHLLPAPKYHRNVKLDLIVVHLVLDFFFHRRCLLYFLYCEHDLWAWANFGSICFSDSVCYWVLSLQNLTGRLRLPWTEANFAYSYLCVMFFNRTSS